MKATKDDGCWHFVGTAVDFHADVDERTAKLIVAALSSHSALLDVANRLIKAEADYQAYDYALSVDNIKAIAKQASHAVAKAGVYEEISITLEAGSE